MLYVVVMYGTLKPHAHSASMLALADVASLGVDAEQGFKSEHIWTCCISPLAGEILHFSTGTGSGLLPRCALMPSDAATAGASRNGKCPLNVHQP